MVVSGATGFAPARTAKATIMLLANKDDCVMPFASQLLASSHRSTRRKHAPRLGADISAAVHEPSLQAGAPGFQGQAKDDPALRDADWFTV